MVKERTSQPSAAAALAMRAPSMCTYKPFACATSTMALISSGVYTVATSVDCVTPPDRAGCGAGRHICQVSKEPCGNLAVHGGDGVILQPTTASTARFPRCACGPCRCTERSATSVSSVEPEHVRARAERDENTSTSSPNSALSSPRLRRSTGRRRSSAAPTLALFGASITFGCTPLVSLAKCNPSRSLL